MHHEPPYGRKAIHCLDEDEGRLIVSKPLVFMSRTYCWNLFVWWEFSFSTWSSLLQGTISSL